MIRLFACDLDGTLLNRFHKTDKMIIKTIDKVLQNHCYFTIATGRTIQQVQLQSAFKNRKIYNICMNGAIIMDSEQNIIYEKSINKDILTNLLYTFPHIHFECITKEYIYTRISKNEYIKHFQKMNIWTRLLRKPMIKRFLKDCLFEQSNEDIIKQDILKINCHVHDLKQRKELDQYLLMHQDDIVNAPFSQGMYEMTDREVNKGHAVKILATLLNVSDQEVAVYGDGDNDIVMLEMFEHSYAPSHSSVEAKRVAGSIIGSSHFHSVAKHICQTIKRQS